MVDDEVLGRDRDDERATMEELSGEPLTVARPSRAWLLVLAGIAAVACLGFAGNLFPASLTRGADAARPSALASTAPSGSASAAVPAMPAIELVRPQPDQSVSGGLISVAVRATPGSHVHLSVTIGAAVLGWRNVDVPDGGTWTGDLRVFAPQAAVPAVVHAAGTVDGSPVEVQAAITLGGGPEVELWDASVQRPAGGDVTVSYHAAAPLALRSIESWVTDGSRVRLGASIDAIKVDDWVAGSEGARDFGLGSVNGSVPLHGRTDGPLVLNVTWQDPTTGTSGEFQQPLDASGAAAP